MTKLIAYHALHFVDQLRNDPKYQIWADFYKIFNDPYIGISDRSKQFKFPINTVITDDMAIPEFIQTDITYRDCCLTKAAELIKKQEELDVPIHIMYSGGIDSTVVLSSFIDLLGIEQASKRITVVMSKESLDENPHFWYKFIRPHLTVKASDTSYNTFKFDKCLYVTGELNDQLFGSDIQQDVSLFFGNDYLNQQATVELLSTYLKDSKKISNVSALHWAKLLIKNLDTCPKHNNTIWDVLWWYNFCWKWIYVYYRILLFSRIEGKLDTNWLENNYHPFFAHKQFQLWSMNNTQPKHNGTWQSYKYTAKKYICEIYGSDEYMYKVKRQSLQNISDMKYRNHSITEDFMLTNSNNISIESVCQSENDLNE